MKRCVYFVLFSISSLQAALLVCEAQPALQLIRVNEPRLWQRLEFVVTNVPTAENPFDPDLIRLDAVFTLPSGGARTVPGFWYQGFQRRLSGGYEQLTASGLPQWRLRFAPPEPGSYNVNITVLTNGQFHSAAAAQFTVPATNPPPGWGYARIAPSRQYFETGDGRPLRLIGANVCWPGGRGTYDYDDWFPAMQAAGENFARLWMCPWAFGIETASNSLTRYSQGTGWRLDYVFELAETNGIHLQPALDYHGMYEQTPDYWGGNDYWRINPYNVTNGGPCLNPNGFFTNTVARTIYQKRLRYLIARYGYSTRLLAWQFFNEIDNVYKYLIPGDVAAWHGIMGAWFHANDPYGHLVSTSLTGGSDRPEIWTLPELDFAAYHSYGEAEPARRMNDVAQSFLLRYDKPVLMDEFGIDFRGWNRTNDPYLRGFRQALWGGALGGSVGTSMSWWWENLHSENVYPLYTALGNVLKRTGWGEGTWTNLAFQTSGEPPATVGELIPNGEPFQAFLSLSAVWGGMPPGELALPNGPSAAYAATMLNGFVHGIWHADLKTPFRINAWLASNAQLVLHLNSVSEGAILAVLADGEELYRTNLPNLDGYHNLNDEYNLDIPVNLPPGKHTLVVTNAGTDWFFLDSLRVEQVLPSTYSGDWQPSPDAIGLRGARESLLYVVAPYTAFPGSATNAVLPLLQGQTITLTNWPSGPVYAEWYDPASATSQGFTKASGTNGSLTLTLPDFSEDLAAVVYPPPTLTSPGRNPSGLFQFQFNSETGGKYLIERSTVLPAWTVYASITNETGTAVITDPSAITNPWNIYRARK